VVAVTGATSGIGRASALRFARRGSSLALCARAEEPLRQVARECEAAGGRTLIRALDVADEAAVEAFAQEAVDRFGRLDVWVNNAGVIAYGEFLEMPSDVFRRVVETNLMGQVHGELVDEEDIHVTTVAPEAVDTPIFDHAANYSGHRIRPVPPVLPPERIAEGIEACAESPKGEVSCGRAGKLLEVLYVLAPSVFRGVAHGAFVRGTLARAAIATSSGNVLASTEPHTVEGSWRMRRRPTLRRAFAAALAGAVAGQPRWRRRRNGVGRAA